MKTLLGLLSITILLTGCLPQDYIEELGIITAITYDQIDDNKIRGTMVIYQFDPTTSQSSQVITSEAETSKGVRYEADRLTSHKLVSGQVRLGVFGKGLATKGLMKFMDTLSRDAKISDMGYLAVSEAQAGSLISSKNAEDQPNTGTYIQRLIEKSINNEMIPNSVMRTYMHDFHDTGVDPVLPILANEDGKAVIRGLALFQDDRMVSQLSEENIFYLMLLRQDLEGAQVQIQLPSNALEYFHKSTSIKAPEEDQLHVSIHEINSDIEHKPKKGDPTTHSVTIDMEARLLEITKDIDLKQKKAIKKLETEIEVKITERLQKVIDQLKEESVDPIGFGKVYNESNRNNRVTKENWREKIQDLSIQFDVNIKLLRHGITE